MGPEGDINLNINKDTTPKEETMAEKTLLPDHVVKTNELTQIEKQKLRELLSDPEKYRTFKTNEFFPAYRKLLTQLDDPNQIHEVYDQAEAIYRASEDRMAVEKPHPLFTNDFHWNESNQHFTTGRLYEIYSETESKEAKEAIQDILAHTEDFFSQQGRIKKYEKATGEKFPEEHIIEFKKEEKVTEVDDPFKFKQALYAGQFDLAYDYLQAAKINPEVSIPHVSDDMIDTFNRDRSHELLYATQKWEDEKWISIAEAEIQNVEHNTPKAEVTKADHETLKLFNNTADFEKRVYDDPEAGEKWLNSSFLNDERYSLNEKWLEDRQRTLLDAACRAGLENLAAQVTEDTKDPESKLGRIAKWKSFFSDDYPGQIPEISYDQEPTGEPIDDTKSCRAAIHQGRFDEAETWIADIETKGRYKNLIADTEEFDKFIRDRKHELRKGREVKK